MTSRSRFQVEKNGKVIVLRVTGESLMAPDAEELCEQLLAFVAARQPQQMVVNFSDVTRCSTAVINALLLVKKRLLSADGEVKLCGVRDGIRHVYRILNLDGTVFQIHDTLDEAVRAFQTGGET